MPTRNTQHLLSKAPAGRHACQFHRDAESLAPAVALFAGTGLQRGDSVVIIATPEHTGLFIRDLEKMELDVEAHRESGQLVLLDAASVLREFMQDGMPDWNRFRRTLGSVLDNLKSRPRSTTRAYGEMVNILWRDGNPRAAIRLEEYWNELSRVYPFMLFCGYILDGLDPATYEGPLHEIGRTHTDILPTEEDDRLRAAVDAASEDVLGLAFSLTISFSGREQTVGEHRLPIGRRTMLWLQRNMPGTSGRILERARHYFTQNPQGFSAPPARVLSPDTPSAK